MSGGAQQQAYLLSENPWPGSLSFGFPPRPVERDHWLIKAAASHVGGDFQTWGVQEWELTARYLAHALEISAKDYLNKSLAHPVTFKRGRGRPRKHALTFRNALLGDLHALNLAPKRERGRPPKSDEHWATVYDLFTGYREELAQRYANKRINSTQRGMENLNSGSEEWCRSFKSNFRRPKSASGKCLKIPRILSSLFRYRSVYASKCDLVKLGGFNCGQSIAAGTGKGTYWP